MFTGGPAQYTLGHPHSRSVVSGSAGWGHADMGTPCQKNSKPMNKVGIGARNRPVHFSGVKLARGGLRELAATSAGVQSCFRKT